MSELLQRLLSAYTEAEQADQASAVKKILAESDKNLHALLAATVEAFDHERESGSSDEDTVRRMEALAAIAEAAQQHITAVEEQQRRANEAAERLQTARNALHTPEPAEQPDTDQPSADSADDSRTLDPETPAAEPATPAPVAEVSPPTSATGPPPTADETANLPEPIAATSSRSVVPAQRVPLSQLPSNNRPNGHGGRRVTYTFNSAADVPGFPVGAELPDIRALAAALTARMRGLARVGLGRTAQAGVAAIHRTAPAEHTYTNENDWGVVERACNERGLDGGNLIAAGGWCAPSETLYDLCPTASVDGLVDLPEVVTRRGGIRFPVLPDFSEIYANIGFHFTEAHIAGDPSADPPVDPALKPCWEIPCVDMTECRLDVDGLCIKTPILTERGWPELVEYFMEQALAAHAHRINAWILARMTELADKVDIPGPTGSPPNVVDPHGPGATASVLSILELYVEHIRLKYRLAEGATLEMVAPRWLRGIVRADLSKRLGIDLLNVTNAMINSYFALRGVLPQWVVDWQDAFGLTDTVAPGPPATQPPPHGIIPPIGAGLGSADWPLQWPDSVQILLYPAGSLFRMSADVITLDGVYDAASLARNEYTKLFSEEGVQVCSRCYTPVAVTVHLCPNGLTGAGVERVCAAPPAPEATELAGAGAKTSALPPSKPSGSRKNN